jgi:signal transduction histidine kinase
MNHYQKSIVFFLVIVFSIQSSFAQYKREIDSIKNLLEMSKNLLYEDSKKSLEYAKTAENKYLDIYGDALLADINYRIGTVYYLKAEYASALERFINANDIYLKLNDSIGIITGYTGLGLVEMGIENYEISIEYYEKARKYIKSHNNKNMCVINFNVGLNYYYLEDYDNALKYIKKSFDQAKANERFDIEMMAYINLANYHLTFKNNDSALIYLNKVENHPSEPNLWNKTYLKKGMAKYYLAENNLTMAEEEALASMEIAKKLNLKWEIKENLETLSQIAFLKNDFKNAFLFKQQQQIYNDSINSENRIRKIKYLLYQKKDKENQRLTFDNKTIKSSLITAKTIVIISFVICIISVILLLLYRKNLKSKTKFNEELNNKNKEIISQNSDLEEMISTKTKILSIISHDMKSPLAAIKQVLMMYNDKMLTKEEQDELLKKLLIQVESTIEMLTNLVFWAKKQANGIKVNKVALNPLNSLKNIIKQNKVILDLKEIDIYLKSDGFENTKIIIDPDQFRIICQNIIANSIKYSFNNSKINILFSENNKNLKIHFIDEGVGMTKEKIKEITNKNSNLKSQLGTNDEKGSGLGLVLAQSLLELNNGHLEISSELNKGSEFIIHLNKTI